MKELLTHKLAICTSHNSVKSAFSLTSERKLLQSHVQQLKNVFVLNETKSLWSVGLISSQLQVFILRPMYFRRNKGQKHSRRVIGSGIGNLESLKK